MATTTNAGNAPLRIFIPLSKIDIEKRLVYGVATAEEPDRANEVCDYASTKPYYKSWSEEVAKNSGGKSLGNVRAMHGKVAAGKVTEINFDDDAKKIEVCAKVVDNDEWNKVVEGVYTGFSQGGRYVKRWDDDATGLTRYTAEPSEISLVDLPCLPSATFSVIKADGAELTKVFKSVIAEPTVSEVFTRAEELAKKAGRLAGDTNDDDINAARSQLLAEALAKAMELTSVDDMSSTGNRPDPSDEEIEAEAKRLASIEPSAAAVADEHRKRAKANLLAITGAAAIDVTGVGGDIVELSVPVGDQTDGSTIVDAQAVLAGKAADVEIVDEPKQGFWDGERFHIKKKDAEKAIRDRKIAKQVDAVTGPVDAALAELAKGLGIEDRSADVELTKKDYSAAERKKMAETGEARDDGSYPIKTAKDVENAVKDFGRAGGSEADKKHIIARAKAIGATGSLPADWSGSTKKEKAAAPSSLFKADATEADKAKVHIAMANFHASQSDDPAKADLHRRAAAAHSEAFLAHNSGADNADEKSDAAFAASRDCLAEKCDKVFADIGSGLLKIDERPGHWQALNKYIGEEAWDASTAIGVLNTLFSLLSGEIAEDEKQPDQLAALRDAIARVKDFIVSEIQENNDPASALEAAAKALDLAKRGARNSAPDQGRLQKCHDLLKELGAACETQASGAEKSAQSDIDRLTDELAAANDLSKDLAKKVEGYGQQIGEMTVLIKKFERAPQPAKAALFATSQRLNGDVGGGSQPSQQDIEKAISAMSPQQVNILLTKRALANPAPVNF